MDLGIGGRVALVTGGSRGIGQVIAQQLAREGAYVAVTYRRARDRAEAVADEIRGAGGRAMAVPLELSSIESSRAAVEAVTAAWGRMDILVNNAVDYGPRAAIPFERLPHSEWQRLLRVNVEGPYAVLQAVVPVMRQQQWGRIVSLSSIVAEDGFPGTAWYATAKSALHGLTRSLMTEFGQFGILANVVMPGVTLTDSAGTLPEERRETYVRMTPIGRLLPPEEVAPMVVFLCSGCNTAVTGEVIRVSGGGRLTTVT